MTKIFCAIDTKDPNEAEALIKKLKGVVPAFKLGLEFFTANGPAAVQKIRMQIGPDVELFLDLKLHDIPNTVAGAVKAAAQCGADYLTIHSSGGKEMMQAAVAAATEAENSGFKAPKILAVTVLTHLDDGDLASVGQTPRTSEQVLRLAKLAVASGVHGAVCSPHEIGMLREHIPSSFLLVVPGIRPVGSSNNDQKRVMTPQEASALGANYLVIGRPITQASDPVAMARSITF